MQTAGTLVPPTALSENEPSEDASRYLWCGVVMGLLCLQLVGCVFALIMATTSSSMAVIPDYHQKAMQWDAYQAEQAATAALGWKETIDVSGTIDIMENRFITIRIEDTDSNPLDINQMEATIYHHADAATLHEVKMEQLAPGTFRGKLRIRKAGLWQVETKIVTADRTVKLCSKHEVKD